MIVQSEIEAFVLGLKNFKFIQKLRETEFPPIKWGVQFAFEGSITISDNTVNLIIGFDNLFPFSKPLFFLNPFDSFGLIPHVEADGYICYSDDNVIIDFNRSKDLIEDTLEKVIETLENGITNKNEDDFLSEIEDYWVRNKKLSKGHFFSNIESYTSISKINWRQIGTGVEKKIIFGSENSILFACQKIFGRNEVYSTLKSAIYVPLLNGQNLLPKSYDTFWTFKEIRKIIYDNLEPHQKEVLERILSDYKKANKIEYLLLGIDHSDGFKILGIEIINSNSKAHPLVSIADNFIIKPTHIIRLEKNVIKARQNEKSKIASVLLIGCGSVGSRIALELMSFGIESIYLVDDDKLFLENIYRHQLGVESVGKNKAEAIEQIINKKFPFEKAKSYSNKIENLIINEEIDLKKFDLIISATGSPNTNLFINQYMINKQLKVPIIYSWNEPYGIGGHNLLVSNNIISCYKCLYDGLINRASFCLPEQSFVKKIAGCSSGFIPFSNIDSLKTSLDCIELIKQKEDSKDELNYLKSWKGNNFEFTQAGYKVAERYKLSKSSFEEKVILEQNINCQCANESKK